MRLVPILLIHILTFPNQPKEDHKIEYYVIPRINLNDARLTTAFDDYLNTYKEDLVEYGVLVLKKDAANKCYYLTHRMFKEEIEDAPPTFFYLQNGRVVLVYTGFEDELRIGKESFQKLYKAASKFFANPMSLNYDTDIWKITLEKGEMNYAKTLVDRIPLDY